MFEFLVFEVAAVGFCSLSMGLLLSYLMPVDPARLSGPAAWVQANKDPRPGSSIPLRPFRWAAGLIAGAVLAYLQYGLVYRILIAPTAAVASGPPVAVWFVVDETILLAWSAYLIWAFRQARARSG
jgi:hypothetical protein